MKPDNASGQKNTPLAASIEFLCYIVKGNMIRVINTENPQEKLLIKGHTNEVQTAPCLIVCHLDFNIMLNTYH